MANGFARTEGNKPVTWRVVYGAPLCPIQIHFVEILKTQHSEEGRFSKI